MSTYTTSKLTLATICLLLRLLALPAARQWDHWTNANRWTCLYVAALDWESWFIKFSELGDFVTKQGWKKVASNSQFRSRYSRRVWEKGCNRNFVMSIRARCAQSQDALFTLCCREFSSWFESRGNLQRVPPRVFQTFESCHLRTDIAWHDFSCSQNRVSAKTRKCTATPASDTRGTSSWRQVEKRTKENAKEKKR